MSDKPKLKKNLGKEEKSSYITRQSEHGMLLFDYDRDTIYETNDTATFIVELMNGENTKEDILNKVFEEYDVEEECARCDFEKFLKKIEEYKLVKY